MKIWLKIAVLAELILFLFLVFFFLGCEDSISDARREISREIGREIAICGRADSLYFYYLCFKINQTPSTQKTQRRARAKAHVHTFLILVFFC